MRRRYSRQRELILNSVRSCSAHPTADMVYQMLTPSCPNLSRGTVYRNLNLLAEEGSLQRMSFPVERYDGRLDPHPHFVCRSCGEVSDLDLPYHDELNQQAADASGHTVSGHALYFFGDCKNCSLSR